ncbi:MAG TPA: hypothetical protein VHU80_20380 [Polyangiaceae bacterium]|jgi:hypothetical protein|nr:hypothetical protein [Polyangiaceae bacterium]
MKARVFSVLALALCMGCGGGNANVEPVHPRRAPRAAKPAAPIKDLGFAATRLAMVPQGTFGPYRGTRPEGMIAAWAAEVAGKRSWLTLGLGDGSALRYDPARIADAAPEIDLVAIRPFGGGTRGFVLLTSSREFSGERVDLLALGTRGERIGGPLPLAQSIPSVMWLDAVQTASGAIAMWAVRRDDRAEILGAEIGPSGVPKDPPQTLLTDLRAWQVASSGEGVAVLALTVGKGRNEPGPLKLFFLDPQGKLERRSVVVADGLTAEPDVDLAKIGDHLVAAWSDRREGEPRLYGAVFDNTGTLLKPAAPLGRPFGPQSVVRVVPPTDGGGPAFLAWENAIERPDNGRAVRVATLSANGVLGEQSALIETDSTDATPEVAATNDGIAALTVARACTRGGSCDGARAVPTFVRLDTSMGVVASEPLRLLPESGEPADLAWGLVCRAGDCTSLTVTAASPSPVYFVRLSAISSDWMPAASRANDAARPRLARVESLAKSEPLVEIAAARTGSGSLLAWLTYFDPATPFTRSKTPAPDGKYEPPRAILRVRALPDKGAAPEPVAVSYRADSPGGTAVVAGDTARGTSLLAWVGVDDKVPQVFVTLLGPDGKKLAQKMLSHSKIGVSDVAAAYTGDGWALGWVDEGTNTAEVRVTKVDPTLRVVVPEHRVGAGGSTASSVQLLARGDHVVVAWADAPVSTSGSADVFVASLGAKDLVLAAPEHPVSQTPSHSRAPALASFGDGAVVGWVEDSLQSGAPSTLMLARVDAHGEPVAGSIAPIALDGSPESVAIECSDTICHVVVALSAPDGGSVGGFVWRGGGDVHVTKFVNLRTQPRAGLAPVLSKGDVLYADQGARGEVVVRRLGVDWE